MVDGGAVQSGGVGGAPGGAAAALPVGATIARILTFRATREELLALDERHFAAGLAVTWLVGVGRYWDAPDAYWFQHAGLISVGIALALAAVLWLVVAVVRPGPQWTLQRVATFVVCTSPPALLYAIPVERFMPMEVAQGVNVWFLAIVAAWRVALWIWLQFRLTPLRWRIIVTAMLPLAVTVTSLTLLNLQLAVFQIMGGLRETAHDGEHAVLFVLTLFSMLAAIPLILAWLSLILDAWLRARKARLDAAGASPAQAA